MRRDEALQYLQKRGDFHAVGVVPRLGYEGAEQGFDVVLRLDGSYADRGMAVDVGRMLAMDILPALGMKLEWAPEDVRVHGGVVVGRHTDSLRTDDPMTYRLTLSNKLTEPVEMRVTEAVRKLIALAMGHATVGGGKFLSSSDLAWAVGAQLRELEDRQKGN